MTITAPRPAPEGALPDSAVITLVSRPCATVAIRDIMPGVQAELNAVGDIIRLRLTSDWNA
ncbi:hypothetical protein Gdia_2668 [Gluconacetobacter diazotrophicus PA1 5]|uniref:hypothetical protein n=1 Tax=Gluconacetobacter diazotrophicus TaxID=33996 RepID=UPI000173DC35|nr:hypothetical protein [Gluconacetobacter diazotrophicus]ACI52407.1 hypothetical protein Gdia_2668 [Gluconacetobacter diazotrophicus PA1 5]TWA98201.1 hypothetical protein FBZ86_1509 [Gluconacetobacter diazotrophicus]